MPPIATVVAAMRRTQQRASRDRLRKQKDRLAAAFPNPDQVSLIADSYNRSVTGLPVQHVVPYFKSVTATS